MPGPDLSHYSKPKVGLFQERQVLGRVLAVIATIRAKGKGFFEILVKISGRSLEIEEESPEKRFKMTSLSSHQLGGFFHLSLQRLWECSL